MKNSFKNAIDKYLRACKRNTWVFDESYKFEFANFIYHNVNWETQTDNEILTTLLESQKIKYSGTGHDRGIQFILKSGREKMSDFISLKDVELLRNILTKEIYKIDWSERTMSYTVLSAWITSLFPEKFYPVPMKGFDDTIEYLFGTNNEKFPKAGIKYIIECQSFMKETWENLNQYPIENIVISEWNKFYKSNPELNIPLKTELEQVDKAWLVQDFHLFVHRKILELYQPKEKEFKVQNEIEPIAIEGNSVLAKHMRYERNISFIKKIKEKALVKNKMLNCQVCGFSFLENYGEFGEGFIEAHHKKPLSEIKVKSITKEEDIALVCSNCHRMLHRGNPTLSIEQLKQKMNKNAL